MSKKAPSSSKVVGWSTVFELSGEFVMLTVQARSRRAAAAVIARIGYPQIQAKGLQQTTTLHGRQHPELANRRLKDTKPL